MDPNRDFLQKKYVLEHIEEKKFYLASSRFTNDTWSENRNFCANFKNNKTAYCSPIPISVKIPPDVLVGVLEMNNDTNRIIGIGFIHNKTYPKTWIYEHGNYNRNTYIGKRRIDRSDMNESEEKIMELLDSYCFKGNGHLKRGQGITSFPVKYLFNSYEKGIDILQEIKNMFNSRIKKNENK
jgi:FAD/FMN-containing dehydrogenase